MINVEILKVLRENEEFNAKVSQAKSEHEFLKLLNEYGIDVSAGEYEEFLKNVHEETELSEDDLDNVNGGCKVPEYWFKKFLIWLVKRAEEEYKWG